MATIPTVRIVNHVDGSDIVINEADFDPNFHELADGEVPGPAPIEDENEDELPPFDSPEGQELRGETVTLTAGDIGTIDAAMLSPTDSESSEENGGSEDESASEGEG